MSDPAIEAAKRLLPEAFGTRGELGSPNSVRGVLAVDAAREALQPIRELHRPIALGDVTCCIMCRSLNGALAGWPCATARLVYSTEELTSE